MARVLEGIASAPNGRKHQTKKKLLENIDTTSEAGVHFLGFVLVVLDGLTAKQKRVGDPRYTLKTRQQASTYVSS